ncbi:MAG: sulfatase [Acidobacteria bacterium]|nr:sulfatase [Acidobacteriota bacterium]
MNRRELLTAAATAAFLPGPRAVAQGKKLPNVLWLTAEDNGPQWGCYGYPLVRTPNVDRLAAQGIRFTRAFSPAPVCSSSRSSFMTGMYSIATGAHHHRSHRGDGFHLPKGVRLVTDYFRDKGYFTCNIGRDFLPELGGQGKTDFNFAVDGKPFDGDQWSQRKSGQPFFAHFNFQATHKGPAFPAARKQKRLIDPRKVDLPPYYADHPVIRDEFANYLDCVNLLDHQVGLVLKKLEADGLADNTVVFFFGDNGRCLLRGKQWCYDAGVHVPLVVRWPGGPVSPGSIREDPVTLLDVMAASIAAAGVEIPRNMHGQPMFGPEAKERDYIFTQRDRCDMTLDRLRAVRTRNYNYIRNFMPEKPYTQHNDYIKASYPAYSVMMDLHAQGKLQGSELVFMAARKPGEELYDVLADPHEVNNLASSSEHAHILRAMREKVNGWIEAVNDQGRIPEPRPPEEMDKLVRGAGQGGGKKKQKK